MYIQWDTECKPRYIYLLIFDDWHVYVGQTATPRIRIKAHMSKRGGWKKPFKSEIIDCIDGNTSEAVFYEYTWRWFLHTQGWKIICQDGSNFDMTFVNEDAKKLAESF
jgi:hypothetical protein